MKLITWNCQGGFRKKADIILMHRPDILVIQECEHPDKLLFSSTTRQPNDFLWFGDNHHKGLGVFSYSNYKFQIINEHNSDLKIILPISVTGGELDFKLFAIWANNPQDKENRYIEQVWNFKALTGVRIYGLPLEELLFGFSFGFMWTGIYEHFTWKRSVTE